MDILNKYLFTLFGLMLPILVVGQEKKNYRVRTIAFYNVENLFDIKDDTLTFDDDRTPEGKYRWTKKRYHRKIGNIAKVISEIGSNISGTSPDIIGLCEVENLQVLQDLTAHQNLASKDYGIIHFDSPDERGIDVALLYKKAVFVPTSSDSRRLLLFDTEGDRDYTRDQLVVGGLLDTEQLYFIINHWPSRSGGETRSRPGRIAAAKLNKRIMDSLVRHNPEAKIISMGDLNDDPRDESLKKVLKTMGRRQVSDSTKVEVQLFNPMEKLSRKGIGSLAYRDKWNLFDQIFFTTNLLNKEKGVFQFWKAGVFDAAYLKTKRGPYKGYPLRTYAGGSYTDGYSDHFPVYVYLIKETEN